MQYHVLHTTTYSYTAPVVICQNQIHLTPRHTPFQTCLSFQLEIAPEPALRRRWIDAFGNDVWYFAIEEPHSELSVTGRSTVEVTPRDLPIPGLTPAWETVRDQLNEAATAELREIAQFRFESPYVRYLNEAAELAAGSFLPGRPLLEAALDLTSHIFREFEYNPASTSLSTTTADVIKRRQGVCQDFAHLQITCLRSLGIPARYVSGYLLSEPPPGQPRQIGADASHAWLSLFCPGLGWIDLDPTNNVIPQERHVTIGWGRDYSDVSPVKGVFTGGGHHTMQVSVDVAPATTMPS